MSHCAHATPAVAPATAPRLPMPQSIREDAVEGSAEGTSEDAGDAAAFQPKRMLPRTPLDAAAPLPVAPAPAKTSLLPGDGTTPTTFKNGEMIRGPSNNA